MASGEKRRAVVAITGASGATIGISLLAILAKNGAEIYCVISDAAAKIIPSEIDGAADAESALAMFDSAAVNAVRFFGEDDFLAPPASGSFRFDAMAVAPCSMKTLGKIANGIADNLIVRAAEVALKERRRLVVCPRETPLALTHIRNMETLCLAGAVILPPALSFYNKPKTVRDAADTVAARIAQSMGFEQNIIKEWGL